MKKDRFRQIGFDDFRRMANDPGLSSYERIGFPDEYRKGKERLILADLQAKLPALSETGKCVLEIGPGGSPLASEIIRHCTTKHHELVLVDSQEVLDTITPAPGLKKFAGCFPDVPAVLDAYREKVDALLCYSVIHYVLAEGSLYRFLDAALCLLAPGGEMLVGDIPNRSLRNRFFASPEGVRCHREFTRDPNATAPVEWNRPLWGEFTDGTIFGVLQRYREFGFETYLLPQGRDLPMSTRREDVLIRRHR